MVLCRLFAVCLLALAGCEAATAVLETVDELQQNSAPTSLTISTDAEGVSNDVLNAPPIGSSQTTISSPAAGTGEPISVCSFNIQFLGNSRSRDDAALADVVAPYDIVVVQELVSPPYAGTFPDGAPLKPDAESAEFFDAMRSHGFQYVISEEDTGSGDKIHRNGSSTEWWVSFYKPNRVAPANDLPHGFLASDRSNHDYFERVPYAFGFRTLEAKLDFVLISVHLQPGDGPKNRARRAQELGAITAWIDAHDQDEHDFIILGDMNIENAKELAAVTPHGFISLNDECRPTNTNVNSPKPYDHVMVNTTWTNEVDQAYDMQVINLLEELRDDWHSSGPYPGSPYNHNAFRAAYSDHHPVVFRLTIPAADDDETVRLATAQ
ncbi:MAG: endonuclease/exonuclease/phosphatase family protein [Planctomycetales bacterium]|jgi:endonuclease/exonuclease/phosphatase family metal-dependent hydrolase